MVTLMLLAARYKNAIPNDPAFIQRVAHLPRQPNFDNLIAAGFIEVDGDPVQPRPASRVNGKREKKADRFEEFWQLYPRKVKKKQALRTWETRDLDSMADRILAHVKTCASSSQWVRENGKFVPHPTTYLNGDRWEDEAAGERRTDDLPVLEADRLW